MESGFQVGNHAPDGAIPKSWGRSVHPVGIWRIENCLVPVKSFLLTALRLRLMRVSSGEFAKCDSHQMIGIPKLTDPVIRDSCESSCGRSSPIGSQDWFPDNQHV